MRWKDDEWRVGKNLKGRGRDLFEGAYFAWKDCTKPIKMVGNHSQLTTRHARYMAWIKARITPKPSLRSRYIAE
jgi:hypothetical protein